MNTEYNDVNDREEDPRDNNSSRTARPNGRNNSSSMPPAQTVQPNRIVKNLRPLPIAERENVFNEWGAIIKHQDEIDRELKRLQDIKHRERQKSYKMQLDMQYKEMMNKKKGSLSEIQAKEDQMLKLYQRDIEGKQRAEDDKRNQVLNEQKSAATHSINELSVMKRQQQNINDMERQLYYNKLKQQEEIENQRKMEEKEKSKIDQENYSKILQMQHKSKIDKRITEKQADKMFYEAEKAELAKQDANRNKFFEKLSNIQKVNDMKQKKLVEYMEQDPKELRSRQDEVNYIRNMEVVEKKNLKKDIEVKSKKTYDQEDNFNSLSNQLQEKQLLKRNVIAQESAIANYYQKEADKYRQELDDQKRRKQKEKEDYNKALASQIVENKKKKQYSVLMSEHEKRVNDRDIKSYQTQSNTLNAQVIGFCGDNRLEKYIDKSMGVGTLSAQNSPAMSSAKANDLNNGNQFGSSSNLAMAGKMTLNKSTNILTDQEDPPRTVKENAYTIPKLLKVRENMEKEDAFKYRANTNNRGYGFAQTLQKVPPPTTDIAVNEEINPYEYNYYAPGNY